MDELIPGPARPEDDPEMPSFGDSAVPLLQGPDETGKERVGTDIVGYAERIDKGLIERVHVSSEKLRLGDVITLSATDPDQPDQDIHTKVEVSRVELPIIYAGRATADLDLGLPRPQLWAKISGENLPEDIHSGDEVRLSGTAVTRFGSALAEGVNTGGYLQVSKPYLNSAGQPRAGTHRAAWPVEDLSITRRDANGNANSVPLNSLNRRGAPDRHEQSRRSLQEGVQETLAKIFPDMDPQGVMGVMDTGDKLLSLSGTGRDGSLTVLDKKSGKFVQIDFNDKNGGSAQVTLPVGKTDGTAPIEYSPTGNRINSHALQNVSEVQATYTFSARQPWVDGAINVSVQGDAAAALGVPYRDPPSADRTLYLSGETVFNTYDPRTAGANEQIEQAAAAFQLTRATDGTVTAQLGDRHFALASPETAIREAHVALSEFTQSLAVAGQAVNSDVIGLTNFEPVALSLPEKVTSRQTFEPSIQPRRNPRGLRAATQAARALLRRGPRQ